MCKSKANGGQRCYGHSSRQLAAAEQDLDHARRVGGDVAAAEAALMEARVAHASNEKGEAELRAQAASFPVGTAEHSALATAMYQGVQLRHENDSIGDAMRSGNSDGNIAMVEIAASTAGVSLRDSQVAFVDLKAEAAGLNLSDPTQAEVVDFLTEQQSRVRNDDSIATPKRKALMARLHAAVDGARRKILPDAATLHAWKNVVAEAWSKTRRKVALAGAIGITAMTIGACGSGHHATESTPNTTPARPSVVTSQAVSPSSTPTSPTSSGSPANTAPDAISQSAFTHGHFTGPAVQKFGQQIVKQGYEEAVQFTFREGWNSTMMGEKVAPASYQDATSYMTPHLRSLVLGDVAKAANGNGKDMGIVQAIGYTDLTGPNSSKVIDGPDGITNRVFSAGKVTLDKSQGYSRLGVSFTATADVHTQDANGTRYTTATHRAMTYWLVKNTGADSAAKPWLIDALNAYQWSDHATTVK